MKTTVSLKAFHNKVKGLAEKAGKEYYLAQAQIVHYSYSHSVLEFKCYVEDYNWHEGETPERAIELLRNAMFPPKQSISDVVVEVEGGEGI